MSKLMAQSTILTEHQAPITTTDTTQEQSITVKQDMKDVKMVLDLLADGKAAKKEVSQDWDERWDFYNDDQWDKKRPMNKSNAMMNIIKITIQSLLPILTDSQPGFNALPNDPTDFLFAQLVSKTTKSWWQKKEINHVLIEVLMDCMIYDAGILKVTWDHEDELGIGDIKAETIDPREIYLPKEARDFNRNCSWVIHLMRKSVGELKRKFPDKAHLITGDSHGTDKEGVNKEESIGKVTLVSPIDRDPTVKNRSPEGSTDLRDMATVAEAWLDDDAIIEYEEENKETGEVEKKLKRKYPRGKVITILPEKNIKLAEVENPYLHGKKPFVRFIDTILPRRFWGDGEVKPLMSIQRTLNKTLANIVDYMNFTSNPVWLVEAGSGADYRKITNSYGLVIRLNAGGISMIKRDIPPPLPQYINTFFQTLQVVAEKISGASDLTQGRRPLGVTAAAAIDTLQEAAHTRIRLKERNMQVSLGQLGKMVISLMMQYYTEPRVTRITGSKGWPEFFEFYVTQLPDNKVQFNKRDFVFDPKTQSYVRSEKVEQGQPSKGIFDIEVLAGTSLPFAKAQKANLALRLFDSNAIGQKNLLETLEWPNAEQVLEEVQRDQVVNAQGGAV